MARLAGGINQLTQLVEGATKDLGGILGALAEGDLTRRITADYQGTLGELKDNANRTAAQARRDRRSDPGGDPGGRERCLRDQHRNRGSV